MSKTKKEKREFYLDKRSNTFQKRGPNGKLYSVSMRQLGTDDVEEGYKRAGIWWSLKIAEINGQSTFSVSKRALPEVMDNFMAHVKYHDMAHEITAPKTHGLEKLIDGWTDFLKTTDISDGRQNSYKYEIKHFKAYCQENRLTHPRQITSSVLLAIKQHFKANHKPNYAKQLMRTMKMFLSYIAIDLDLCDLPKNFKSKNLNIEGEEKEVVHWEVQEVRDFFDVAKERMRLYALLALNCGMYAKDISDLTFKEVNWEKGIVARKRSKRKKSKNAKVVKYKLWPITFSLLQKYAQKDRTPDNPVLLTQQGGRLVQPPRTDNIRSMFRRIEGDWKPFMNLRHTVATLLRRSKYRDIRGVYLSHADRSMADQRYAAADFKRLHRALSWVYRKLFNVKPEQVETNQ